MRASLCCSVYFCISSGKFLPLIALVVGIVSYSRAALKDDIEAANTKFMAAFASGDATNLGPLYTENCRLMPTGTDVLVGRDGMCVGGYLTGLVSPILSFPCIIGQGRKEVSGNPSTNNSSFVTSLPGVIKRNIICGLNSAAKLLFFLCAKECLHFDYYHLLVLASS